MTKFGYFRVIVPGYDRLGYVTVAMLRPNKDANPQTHVAAFSFCSPVDQFVKAKGRMIAEKRLAHLRTVKVTFDMRGHIREAFNKALQLLLSNHEGYIPKWMKSTTYSEPVIINYGLRDVEFDNEVAVERAV
jgi:hypothetical protein